MRCSWVIKREWSHIQLCFLPLPVTSRHLANRLNDAENVYLYSSEVPKHLNFDPMHGFKKAQQQAKANIIPALNIASSQTRELKPV